MPPNQKKVLALENEDAEAVSAFQQKGYRTKPILFVNGEQVPDAVVAKARPNQTLLSFLRDEMGLTGSKLGCAEGGCGACTVMLSTVVDPADKKIKHFSVNACLMPVLAADGCHVTTVEGIGTVKNDNLHPIQKAMVDMHGSQCGFCTPGIIVSIYTLFANHASLPQIEEHLDGNLCRCTGYRPIWDAARSLCDDTETIRGPCGIACRDCPEREECEQECNVQDKKVEMISSSSADKMKQYKETFLKDKESWSQQPNVMFPKALLDGQEVKELAKPLMVVDRTEYHAGGTWFKPTTFQGLLSLLQEFGGNGTSTCKIVVGNTEVGIETRFKHAVYPRLIHPSESIEEIFGFAVASANIEIGSCCPLSTIQHKCSDISTQSTSLKRTALPIHDMLRWFASTQIRNVACLGGNLVTASPISDMNPMLACLGAKLILSSLEKDGSTITRRAVPVSDFFLKYRTVDLKPTELVERIEVPIVNSLLEYVKPFKQARRREDDISIVTSGMRMRLAVRDGKYVIDDISIAFGGMAPTTIMSVKTMEALKGAEFNAESFKKATAVLLDEMKLPEEVPGGQAAYRMTLASSFLYKFYLSAAEELRADCEAYKSNPSSYPDISELPPAPETDPSEATATRNFISAQKPSSSGTQFYPAPKVAKGCEEKILPKVEPMAKKDASAVGQPTPHMSGPLHCTGEALYTDDIPLPPKTLQAALVLSNECGRILESMDITPALAVPGVAGVFTFDDLKSIGGKNEMGPIFKDEVLFLPVGSKVTTVGQVLGVCVAETLEAAELGARSVEVSYSGDAGKVIVTIADAIEANSFYEASRHKLVRGDATVLDNLVATPKGSTDAKVGDTIAVAGSFSCGAQEHFYLETNSTLAVPSEANTNLTIYASTQAATKTQTFCALTTGTPAMKVVCHMKRMGGGFGGKETRSVFASCAAAVAAKCSSRPVRLTLPRDVDMSITGTRHAFSFDYKASAQITESGAKLVAMDIKLFNNGGHAFDLSGPVMDRALFHVDGCYYFPNFRAEGVVCKTSQAPHTAFRGFGGPQGIAACEHVMDHLALACKVSGDDFRRNNMYQARQATHFGMILDEDYGGKWNVPSMWDRLATELDVPKHRAAAAEFNAKNKWVKRGISLVPTKFGIAFTAKYMNQGGSLVHLYTDGTVLVSHGGTEMGQGLHTKVCQVAAQAFGIPVEDVYVNDTSTDKVANTIPTAASHSTDMYGMSTLDACRQIIARLDPIRKKLGPDATLKEIASAAFMERIDLSAHGFFRLIDSRCGYDWAKEKPDDFPADQPANSWKGHPFNYFTQGVCFAEVEVDTLTGNHRTLRSDVIIDVGSSINPAIDIGQVEGAFIQGMGWSTIEEVVYADDDHTWIRPRGKLFTTGPGTYKIPSFNDVPEVFNVSLQENVDNPFAVHSSKAIGEPPFFLGSCVFYAIKDAVRATRKQNLGTDEYFEFRMPATSERIRMFCGDQLAKEATAKMLGKEISEQYQTQGSY